MLRVTKLLKNDHWLNIYSDFYPLIWFSDHYWYFFRRDQLEWKFWKAQGEFSILFNLGFDWFKSIFCCEQKELRLCWINLKYETSIILFYKEFKYSYSHENKEEKEVRGFKLEEKKVKRLVVFMIISSIKSMTYCMK